MSADWIPADWPAPSGVVAGTTLRNTSFADLELAGRPCWLAQVHGSHIVVAANNESAPTADGSVANRSDQVCVIRSADCLPVLLCSTDGSVVAAAHAGWRGLSAGVIENAVRAMRVPSDEILAWLGPAISQPSFEVGVEVKAAFEASDSAAATCFEQNARGRWQGDLYGLAKRRLASVGVFRVYGGGFCTYQDRQRFFSYRRNPDCGRMVSFIGLGIASEVPLKSPP